MAGLALSIDGCCEGPAKPCLAWLEAGEVYRVDLVQRFDTQYDDGLGPLPYERYQVPDRSCGSGLDLEEGSSLTMAVGEKTEGDGRNQLCEGGCYYRRAIPSVQGVVRLDGSLETRDLGDFAFSDRFQAAVGDGDCMGAYTIGIARVDESFLEFSDEYVATDHMLYRGIATANPEACVVSGSQITEVGRCADSWAVRIFDSEGREVTRDLPPRDPGAGDAGIDGTDGGG